MPLSHKTLDQLTEGDLQQLVAGAVREARRIEYKRQLPGGGDEDKREFLADVSSFANASGGDILYGIEEEGGLPTGVVGLELNDVDAELLRLESIIRAGIAPRLVGFHARAVPLSAGRHVLVLRVPQSWTLPHMVTFKNLSRFFSRTSAGKYQLDVSELRSLFARAGNAADRIRQFRDGRLAALVAGEGPFELSGRSLVIIHVVPLRFSDPGSLIDLRSLEVGTADLSPIWWPGGGTPRWNLDGYATFADLEATGSRVGSYVQLFRSGAVEAVSAEYLRPRPDGALWIPGQWLVRALLQSIAGYLRAQRAAGLDLPVVVLITLVGVKGYRLAVSSLSALDRRIPIDRDVVQAVEVIVEDWDSPLASTLRPALDTIWNAAGWRQCSYYDEGGELRLAD